MKFNYETVRATVVRNLREAERVTEGAVRQTIDVYLNAMESASLVEEIDRDKLFKDILTHVNIWQAEASVLRDKAHINWVPGRKSQILKSGFWQRYLNYLEEYKGWPTAVTTQLDRTTDNILGDIGDPEKPGMWDRRGMVVGDVQSGKTANYTGLVCKATDAGYKLIIVLAGLTNDLRSQTQSRLDSEFLGFESEVGKLGRDGSAIGVGRLTGSDKLFVQPLTYSSKDGDFKAKNGANIKLGSDPVLLVVKKNVSILARIIRWIESQGSIDESSGRRVLQNVPLLLLDDEADNASVNTKSPDEDPTSINRSIRRILHSCAQSSYVAYTATPFANIFILPDDDESDGTDLGPDLFPKNFIYYITPPSHYVGASKLFGLSETIEASTEYNSLPLIRSAEDADSYFPPKHKKELIVDGIPESLREAICSFILICAARRVRGQKHCHNSMLVHVTRFNNVQGQLMSIIGDELAYMKRMIEYGTGPQSSEFVSYLRNLWDDDFVPTTSEVSENATDQTLSAITWDQLESELLEAALKIEVRGINGDVGGILDYDEHKLGLSVLAIGGDKLSRGLTLEGLSVSYYTRPSKNYDTLLQMGRWFGYRPGYIDLCRLYTTEEIVSWYQHISVATEELKREFRFMELSKLTPEDYGLKVRTHPDGLDITSANKIRTGRLMQVGFSGQLVQTTIFAKSKNIIDQNYSHTKQWLEGLENKPQTTTKNLIWKHVNPAGILAFLSEFNVHPLARKADPTLLSEYIERVTEYGELMDWTVAVISSDGATDYREIAGKQVGLVRRTDKTASTDLYTLNKANIISPDDQSIDLDSNEINIALNNTIKAWGIGQTRTARKPTKASGPFVRQIRRKDRALLLIYLLDPANVQLGAEVVSHNPVVGFAISFPVGSKNELVEYQVNTRYWEERYGSEEDA